MATPEWRSGRIVNTVQMRQLLETFRSASEVVRMASDWLEGLADTVGTASSWIDLITRSSPLVGVMNSFASRLQSLIDDLFNQGAYVLVHHNLREYLDALGVVNTIDSPSTRGLPPVATPVASNPGVGGELIEEYQEEGADPINYASLEDFDGREISIRGFTGWLYDIVKAFDDPHDPRRPRLDESGQIGGALFLFGVSDLNSAIEFVDAFAHVFDLEEFRQLADGISGAEGIDLENFARLRDAAIFRTVQEATFNGRGKAPDFFSMKLADLIPQFSSVLVSANAFISLLQAADAAGNWASELVAIIEHRIRSLAYTASRLGVLLDQLGDLVGLPSIYVLPISMEVGGVANLQARIQDATSRPPYGPGNLLVGGGIFVTTPAAYEVLSSLLFPETPAAEQAIPLFDYEAAARLARIADSDFVIPSSDWATWGGTEIEISRGSSGVYSQQSSVSSGPHDYAQEPAPPPTYYDGAEMRSTSEPSRGPGSGRYDARVSGFEQGNDLGTIGVSEKGAVIKRDSWGAYPVEIATFHFGEGEDGAVMAETGAGTYAMMHVPRDVPRYALVEETVAAGETLPVAILLEGRTNNGFLGSDTLECMTQAGGVAQPLHENGAPTTDLSRYRLDSGPAREVYTDTPAVTTVTKRLSGTSDHAGCYITNLIHYDSTPYTVAPGIIGNYILGHQQIEVLGQVRTSFFQSKIVDIDIPTNAIVLETAVFTPPIALNLVIEPFSIVDGPLPVYVQQGALALNNWINTFSVFAEGLRWDQDENAVSIRYEVDPAGPAYSLQHDLSKSNVRVLLPDPGPNFTVEDKVLVAQSALPELEGGELVELQYSGGDDAHIFYAEEVTEGAQTLITLETGYGDATEYDDHTVTAAEVRDITGTYQGFQRVVMEVPKSHSEHTAFIPAPADPNDLLTLSHTNVLASSLDVYLVGPGPTLTLMTYDPALAGISYDLQLGVGLDGRAAIRVSPGMKTAHAGRFLRAVYDLEYHTGNIRIYPQWVYPVAGLDQAVTTLEGRNLLWRAQWETAPMSSPIPVPPDVGRAREPDIFSIEGSSFLISQQDEGAFTFCYYPTNRSDTILEDEIRYLLYTELIRVYLKGTDTDPYLVIYLDGTEFPSATFSFDANDRLDIYAGYLGVGPGGVTRFKLDINGINQFDVILAGPPVPSIEPSTLRGKKVFIGSDPNGENSCWGQIKSFKIEDAVT